MRLVFNTRAYSAHFSGTPLTSFGRYAIYLMNICLQKELNRMDSEVFARIREYLADQLEVDPEIITLDRAFASWSGWGGTSPCRQSR